MTGLMPMGLPLPDVEAPAPAGERREADFYPTPRNVWRPFVPVLGRRVRALMPGWCAKCQDAGWCDDCALHLPMVVEPACGDGRLLGWMSEMGIPRSRLAGLDIRQKAVEQTRDLGFAARCIDWMQADAADHLPNDGRGCAFVSNGPFKDAAHFTRVCIDRAGPTGLVALLWRITFLEPTQARADLLASTPFDVWIPPKRGKFANGKTDSATTAWFVWPPEDGRAEGHLVRYLGRNDGGQS